MNLLVANDDGINAEGLAQLVKALSSVGKVYVAAPDSQRSASSHALSIGKRISAKKVPFEYAEEAYEINGTPADCVKLGLYILGKEGIKVDAVYSGINHGANLGTDTMYSGTVSAAAEGLFQGLPAVAVSVTSHEARYFSYACELALAVLPYVIRDCESVGVVSINAPNLPPEEIKGVRIAGLGELNYRENFIPAGEENGITTYEYFGEPEQLASWSEDTDARLVKQGYATISSVRFAGGDDAGNERIKNWEMKI